MTFKRIVPPFLFIILISYSAVAQKDVTILSKDLKNLPGCWKGTFNYSGTVIRKPHAATAKVFIQQIGKSKFRFLNIYSKQPGDSSSDTILISKGRRKFNDETIKSKRRTSKGSLKIITEVSGFDNDNNKAAIFRNTYIIAKQIYIYKKEVRLEGQIEWLEREEFKYVRNPCGRK